MPFHEYLDQLTKREKLRLYAIHDAEPDPEQQAFWKSKIEQCAEFIYCCQACIPADAPLDKGKIKPK